MLPLLMSVLVTQPFIAHPPDAKPDRRWNQQ